MTLMSTASAMCGFVVLSACGGVNHATRSGPNHAAKDPTFVEVRTTGLDTPYTIVSWSSWDVALTDPLPAEAPTDVVGDMRDRAAKHGAEKLLLDRVENTWRKVWIGLGVVRADTVAEVSECAQAGYAAAQADAVSRAQTCVKRLLFERPQLAGKVDVLFEVDPHGRILRAAPTPDSSRDGQLQACVLGAVHATTFGAPPSWTCKGRVTITTEGLAP